MGLVINSPRVVAFEGGDNVGKTTIIARLAQRLNETGHSVQTIRQPASCQLGEAVYNLHHQYDSLPINGFARQLLHVACHLQSYYEMDRVEASPFILLSDRSFFSSMAYGWAYPTDEKTRDQEVQWIWEIETTLCPKWLIPSHVVLFRNRPYVIENTEWENYERVRDAYLKVFSLPYVVNGLKAVGTKVLHVHNDPGRQGECLDMITEFIAS